ncbi:MAG: hypothetical protein BroJett042_15110 [Bacteroidota bacterium]|nr:MAG: hypothetical protein BroJett042_15110 [Bacteroidota bacterium]
MKLVRLVYFGLVFLPAILLFQACEEEEILNEEEETIIDDSDMDFVTNSKDTTVANSVLIVFSSSAVSVTNPFESAGVTVAVSGSDVVVTATTTTVEVGYVLSGITTNGSLKINSDYKYNLVLNGVGIYNTDGPAINIQSGKKATVTVVGGTLNKLIDGATYAATETDSKGAFFSEGQLIFTGTGSLYVTGNYKHAICSDDYISITQGDIHATSKVSDAFHINDYFKMSGGTVVVNSLGDGIEVEEGYIEISGGTIEVTATDEGIATTYEGTDTSITPYVTISGGTVTVTTTGDKGHALESASTVTIESTAAVALAVSGKGSKGIKAADVAITGGNVAIGTTGAAFYDTDDADVSSPAGINCSNTFLLDGGVLSISGTGAGGKGIKTDGTLTINKGTLGITVSGGEFTYGGDSYEAKAISSDGAIIINDGTLDISATDDGIKSDVSITINGGTINITKSTEGIEAPSITLNNGNISVISSDDCVNATKGSGGESDDGSLLTFAGGTVSLSSTAGDPVDSNGSVVMTGGTVIVQGPSSQPEVALDYNGTFKVSGGYFIASGPSGNMIQGMSSSSTQYNALIRTSVSANTLFVIQDANGNSLVTYKPIRNAGYFVFSSSDLKTGSYKVLTGGSVSGGTTTNGLTVGGTYTGGTQKGTFTVSSIVTNVTF